MGAGRLGFLALVASAFAFPATQPSSTIDNEPASTTEAQVINPQPSQSGGVNSPSYFSPAWVPKGQRLNPHLAQSQTNGNSNLGTSNAPKLPYWLTGGPMPNGRPWGARTCANTDPYTNPPNTGVTRYYDFTISTQDIWPDGVKKSGIVINGAFPGPTIEANWV